MRKPRSALCLLCILLLAAGLRFYRLDAQSFWNDEGNSARIAERTPALILAGAAGDIHPPGYYLLLHAWRALAGQSEFALRMPSVAAGVVTVALTYALGRRLFDPLSGLMAAFLSAVSPFAIYYSQEARMYALLGALSVASTWLFRRLLAPAPRFRPLAVYVLICAAGLYTQYAFPFVLLVHNALFALWWGSDRRRSTPGALVTWTAAQAAIAVLYLPWLPTALRSVTGWSAAGRGYAAGPAMLEVFRTLSVGLTLPAGESRAALIGAGVLLFFGLWPGRMGRGRRFDLACAGTYLLLPTALIFTFDLYKPSWLKFLLIVLPPLHVLLGRGVGQIAERGARIADRLLPLAPCLLLLVPCLLSLRNLYFNPAYARDDYRRIAADVAAAARPGDAVILNAPNQWEVFTYYYPDRDVYPAPYRPEPGQVEAFLKPLLRAEGRRRLFVLYWGDAESDPQRLIESALAERAYKATDRWYGRVRLASYGTAVLPETPARVMDARFGERIRLHGCAFDDRATPGEILPVTFFWEAEATPGERYKVTAQLLDAAGQLAAQRDEEPRDDLLPTDRWPAGETVVDRCGLLLPPDLPTGRYTLAVALYHIVSGERLPVTLDGAARGDHLTLGEVEIAAP